MDPTYAKWSDVGGKNFFQSLLRQSQNPSLNLDTNYYQGSGGGQSVFGRQRLNQDNSIVDQLNAAVQSGQITQDQANQHWNGYRQQQEEYQRGLDTQSRRNNQQSIVSAGSVLAAPFAGAASGLGAAASFGAKGLTAANAPNQIMAPGATGTTGGGMANRNGMYDFVGNMLPTNPDRSWGVNPNDPNTMHALNDSFLDAAGNLLPAAGGAYLGNKQRQDAMGQVGKINELGDSLGAQSGAYLRSITDPYDQQTGLGRTSLSNALSQRGVGGSSFGNQQLENFDYMRGLGRGDVLTRGQVGIAGTQGNLYGNALTGINQANQNYNNILGAGLGASGSLFNIPGNTGAGGLNIPGLGKLGNLGGISNMVGRGLTSVGSSLGNLFGSPGSTLWGNDPSGTGVSFTGGLPDQPGFMPDLNQIPDFGPIGDMSDWGF